MVKRGRTTTCPGTRAPAGPLIACVSSLSFDARSVALRTHTALQIGCVRVAALRRLRPWSCGWDQGGWHAWLCRPSLPPARRPRDGVRMGCNSGARLRRPQRPVARAPARRREHCRDAASQHGRTRSSAPPQPALQRCLFNCCLVQGALATRGDGRSDGCQQCAAAAQAAQPEPGVLC